MNLPRPLRESGLVVIDFEATSLDVSTARVIQCAALRVPMRDSAVDADVAELDLEHAKWGCWVSNPGEPLSPEIRALLNVAPGSAFDRAIADAPPFAEQVAELAAFCGDAPLVAHNAVGYDGPLLDRVLFDLDAEARSGWRPVMLDSIWLALLADPGQRSYALARIAERDAIGNSEVLGALLARAAAADTSVPGAVTYHDARYDAAVLAVALDAMFRRLATLSEDEAESLRQHLPECAWLFASSQTSPEAPSASTPPSQPRSPSRGPRAPIDVVTDAHTQLAVSTTGDRDGAGPRFSPRDREAHVAVLAAARETFEASSRTPVLALDLPADTSPNVAIAIAAIDTAANRPRVRGDALLVTDSTPARLRGLHRTLNDLLTTDDGSMPLSVTPCPPRRRQVCRVRFLAEAKRRSASPRWGTRFAIALVHRWLRVTQTGDVDELGRWVRRVVPEFEWLLERICPDSSCGGPESCTASQAAGQLARPPCSRDLVQRRLAEADVVLATTDAWLAGDPAELGATKRVLVAGLPIPDERDREAPADARQRRLFETRIVQTFADRIRARAEQAHILVAAPAVRACVDSAVPLLNALRHAQRRPLLVVAIDPSSREPVRGDSATALSGVSRLVQRALATGSNALVLEQSAAAASRVALELRRHQVGRVFCEGEQAWHAIDTAAFAGADRRDMRARGDVLCGFEIVWDTASLAGRVDIAVLLGVPSWFEDPRVALANAIAHVERSTVECQRPGVLVVAPRRLAELTLKLSNRLRADVTLAASWAGVADHVAELTADDRR